MWVTFDKTSLDVLCISSTKKDADGEARFEKFINPCRDVEVEDMGGLSEHEWRILYSQRIWRKKLTEKVTR